MATSVRTRRTEISLWYNKTPISEEVGPDVESITYTDCASDACDSVDIAINARDGKWLNQWFPKKGATLHPKVTGYDWDAQQDRQYMDCGLFVLDDVQYIDAMGKLTLGGVSKPNQTDFSERERTDVWKNTSVVQIGQTIAARYGLGFAYDGDNYGIEKREQNQTDSDFYEKLCKDYGLVLKVYANRLWVYDRERYKSKLAVQDIPRTAMKPGSFIYTTTMAGTYTGGSFAYTDQDKDIDITASVGGGTRTKSMNQYASSVADAAAQLVAALNDANHGSRKISFTMKGNFVVFAGNNVRITGFGPEIDGKYFVDRTTRTIDRNGFTCKVEASGIDDPFRIWQVGGSIQIHEKQTAGSATKYDSSYKATSAAAQAASANAKAGQAVVLRNCPLYISATATKRSNTVSGTYYLYDGILYAGKRYRITNTPGRCGKLPIGQNVTGWIDASYIGGGANGTGAAGAGGARKQSRL